MASKERKPRTILIYGLAGPPIGSFVPSVLFLVGHFFGKYPVQINGVIENFAIVIGVFVGLLMPSFFFGGLQAVATGAALKYFSDVDGRFSVMTAFGVGLAVNTTLCGLLAVPYIAAGYIESLAAISLLAAVGVASTVLVRLIFTDKFKKLNADG